MNNRREEILGPSYSYPIDVGKGRVTYSLEKSKLDHDTVFKLAFFVGDVETVINLPIDAKVAKWLIETLTNSISELEKAKEIR